jgi:hypothetical protein
MVRKLFGRHWLFQFYTIPRDGVHVVRALPRFYQRSSVNPCRSISVVISFTVLWSIQHWNIMRIREWFLPCQSAWNKWSRPGPLNVLSKRPVSETRWDFAGARNHCERSAARPRAHGSWPMMDPGRPRLPNSEAQCQLHPAEADGPKEWVPPAWPDPGDQFSKSGPAARNSAIEQHDWRIKLAQLFRFDNVFRPVRFNTGMQLFFLNTFCHRPNRPNTCP